MRHPYQRCVPKDKAAIQANFTGCSTTTSSATFPEVKKVVDGCRGATLVVDFTLAIPSVGVKQHFHNALTFVRERGQWKIILDVSSPLPVV